MSGDLSAQQKQRLVDVIHDDTATDDRYKPKKRRKICWFIIGFLLLILSVQLAFAPHLIDNFVRNAVEKAFIFTEPLPHNDHYKAWLTNSGSGSVPIKFSIQFFNVTNPDEVLQGAMPKLKLTGPLTYTQYFYRKDVNFSADGYYVNHTFYTEYIYDAEESEIDPNETLTIFSPIIGTLWHLYSGSKRLQRKEMEEAMKLVEHDPNLLFWRDRKAHDLIWSVYDFNLGKFSFQWGFMRNQSNQYYTLHTGKEAPKRMGEVQRWCRDPLTIKCLQNESTEYIQAWQPAMPIRPGHLFYEGIYALTDIADKNDVPPLWVDILYRNIYLSYNGSYTYKGIELYKYGIQLDPQLSNSTQYPPNAQFDQIGPSGIMNISSAYDEIAIYLSMVLFYGAPDYLNNNSKLGIPYPSADDKPYIDIEPKTGSVLYANASMQICTPIHSLPNVNNITLEEGEGNLFKIVDDMMVPMYLVTFSDAAPTELTDTFKSHIGLGGRLHFASVVVGWIATAFLLIWSFLTVFRCGMRYHQYKARSLN